MNETTAKLLTYAAVVGLAALLTKLTTDKKGWRITLLIILVAGATYAEKVVDVFFEKHGPHLIVTGTPAKVVQEDGKIKLYTDIAVYNEGDVIAEEATHKQAYYLDEKQYQNYMGENAINIDVGQTVYIPIFFPLSKDVWEGRKKLAMTLLTTYKYKGKTQPPLKAKWEFEPNKDNALKPMWEIVPFDE